MKRRWIALFLALTMAASLLTGCTKKSDTPAQPERADRAGGKPDQAGREPHEGGTTGRDPGKPGRYAQESGRCGKAR